MGVSQDLYKLAQEACDLWASAMLKEPKMNAQTIFNLPEEATQILLRDLQDKNQNFTVTTVPKRVSCEEDGCSGCQWAHYQATGLYHVEIKDHA